MDIINKEIISKLKFISKIQIGDRINTKYTSIQNDSVFTSLTRFFYQDNRIKTIIFVQETIKKAYELIYMYEKSEKISEKILCVNLIRDLNDSKSGLNNLKDTYSYDLKFCCDIDTIIQIIDSKLAETKYYSTKKYEDRTEHENEEEKY